jgi:hypothetical protein
MALQGAKPTTTRGVAIRLCPQGRDVEGRVPGTEEDMQQLMTEEIAKTVPRLYGQDGADDPIVQLAARWPSRRAFLLSRIVFSVQSSASQTKSRSVTSSTDLDG